MSDNLSAAAGLRERAIRLRSEVSQRIDHRQGGVPTFFDGYVIHLLDHVISNEKLHGWLDVSDPTPGTEKGNLIFGLRWIKSFIVKLDHDRFETYSDRRAVVGKGVCEVGPFELLMSQGVLGCLEWKGRPLFKTVYEFASVPMLLHEVRPGTIFEIGSGTGASALWMADMCMAGGGS